MGKKALLSTVIIWVFLGFSACKVNPLKDVTSIELSVSSLHFNIGGTAQITVRLFNANGQEITDFSAEDISWTALDPAVVQVANGLVSAIGAGITKITVKCSEISAEILVTVNPVNSQTNCRTFDWYNSQMNTGPASNSNCGPTSTHMAVKWYRNTTEGIPSVSDIRNLNYRDGGWWYTTDIANALNQYQVPFATHWVASAQDLTSCLQRGHIALLCVEMKWIAYNRRLFYDRFYTFDSGHFLIVKGFSDDGSWFIVFDPNSWSGDNYANGIPMGRNRFYRSNELYNAVAYWWPYMFEIGAASGSSTVSLDRIPVGHAGPKQVD